MSDPSNDDAETDDLDTVDVFSMLGNEIRLTIVSLLHDAREETPVAFSTLYEDVPVDDSAQFNYHLKQLRPHFVTKREDGYELTAAGRRLARAVRAGTYTKRPTIDPFDIDSHCYACGERELRASYENERFAIDCLDCGEDVLSVHVPPTVVRGRDRADLVDAFEEWSQYQVEQALNGICPDCGGPTEGDVIEDVSETIAFEAIAAYRCSVCGRVAATSFGVIAYHEPIVSEFLRQRDATLENRRTWEIDQYVAGEHVAVRSRDPWRVRVSFYADGDACHVEIDDSLQISRTEIVAGEDPPAR